jgi:hypothetical protein
MPVSGRAMAGCAVVVDGVCCMLVIAAPVRGHKVRGGGLVQGLQNISASWQVWTWPGGLGRAGSKPGCADGCASQVPDVALDIYQRLVVYL